MILATNGFHIRSAVGCAFEAVGCIATTYFYATAINLSAVYTHMIAALETQDDNIAFLR